MVPPPGRPLNCPDGPGGRPPPMSGERDRWDRAPSSTSPPGGRLGLLSLSLFLFLCPCLPACPLLSASVCLSLSPAPSLPSLCLSLHLSSLSLPISVPLALHPSHPSLSLFLDFCLLSLASLPPLSRAPWSSFVSFCLPSLSLSLSFHFSPSLILPPTLPLPSPVSLSHPPLLLASVSLSLSLSVSLHLSPHHLSVPLSRVPVFAPRPLPQAPDGGRQALCCGFCSIKLFRPHSLAPLSPPFLPHSPASDPGGRARVLPPRAGKKQSLSDGPERLGRNRKTDGWWWGGTQRW